MTSMALRRAAEALRQLGIASEDAIAEAEDGPSDPFVEWASEIIRAFAENVTDKMATEHINEAAECTAAGGSINEAWVRGVRAAILEGLE